MNKGTHFHLCNPPNLCIIHLYSKSFNKTEIMIRLFLVIASISLSPVLFGQNQFSFELFNKMDQEKNLLFSPTSIKAALAMAYEGANSETQMEFEKVFGFDEENTAFLDQISQLKESAEISNSVWILEEFEILQSYIDTLESRFNAPPSLTDFYNQPEESAEKINKWIEESTKGMITKMLTPDQVKTFKMALVNAIYFKQDWQIPFDDKKTFEKDFHNLNGTTTSVEMMRSLEYYRAFDGANEKVIELPYSDNKTSMIVVLPNSMNDYELNEEKFNTLTASLYSRKVSLELPKFTFDTPTFELKEMLEQMGLKIAFTDSADFSGMREQKDLKIGTVLHKAKIIVNEKGTEAAAATVIGMIATNTSVSQPIPIMQFQADKPFYYFIRDNATGALLFMGKMNTM